MRESVPRRSLPSLIAVTLALGVTLISGCARPNYAPPARAPGALANANSGCGASFGSECFNIAWETLTFGGRTYSTFLLKTGRPNAGDGSLIVTDTADELDIDLNMPEMGHGTGPVHITRVDVGTYRVSNVYLPHGGLWEIRVRRLKNGRTLDEAALRQTL